MQCPTCKSTDLNAITLDQGLPGHHCPDCGGLWLSLGAYQDWLQAKGEILPEKPPSGNAPQPVSDKRVKLCPNCDHLMLKYRVGRGMDFALDHCGHCGGVWFDRHEWEALKDRNLHDEVYKIFTAPWQREIRLEEARRNFQARYSAKFGEQDYARVRQIKRWLNDHPERQALLAYLNDQDPYQP
jgi:Zn-finger nucleic acid-binding protein